MRTSLVSAPARRSNLQERTMAKREGGSTRAPAYLGSETAARPALRPAGSGESRRVRPRPTRATRPLQRVPPPTPITVAAPAHGPGWGGAGSSTTAPTDLPPFKKSSAGLCGSATDLWVAQGTCTAPTHCGSGSGHNEPSRRCPCRDGQRPPSCRPPAPRALSFGSRKLGPPKTHQGWVRQASIPSAKLS